MKNFILMALTCLTAYAHAQTTVTDSLITTSGFPTANDVAKGYFTVISTAGNSLSDVDKPILVIEDFDPDDILDFTAVINQLNVPEANFLGQQLVTEGYDIIILDFEISNLHLRQNALVVEELIGLINDEKVGTEKTKVLGIGQGGLIARFALSKLESENVDHQCNLFISFDSPHEGSNVPLGLQHAISQSKAAMGVPNFLMIFLEDSMIDCKSQKETMIFHNVPSPSAARTSFVSAMEGLNSNSGYPQNCRNVALSNGSVLPDTQMNGNNAIRRVGASPYRLFSAQIDIVPPNPNLGQSQFAWSLPNISPANAGAALPNDKWIIAQKSNILEGPQYRFFDSSAFLVDNVPGSFEPFFMDRYSSLMAFGGFTINSAVNTTTYIPTTSALGIKRTNMFVDFSNEKELVCETPFDGFYASRNNTSHSDIDATRANWIFDQILAVDNDNTIVVDDDNLNLGYGSQNQISNSFVFKNSAELGLNKNRPIGYIFKNSSFGNVLPNKANSHIRVYTSGCKEDITISIEDGALVLGDGISRSAELWVLEGDELILGNNTTSATEVTVNKDSKIVVEEGGTLRVKPNVNFTLDGPTAQVEIRGTLIIEDGATFEPLAGTNGQGFIHFGKADGSPAVVVAGQNTNLIVEGPYVGYKTIEVDGLLVLPQELNTTIVDGKIEIGENGILEVRGPLTMHDMEIDEIEADKPFKYGLRTLGQAGVDVQRVEIKNGINGIICENYLGGNSPNFSSIDVEVEETGIRSVGAGLSLMGDFTGCENAVEVFVPNKPVKLFYTKAENGTNAFRYYGQSNGSLRITYGTAKDVTNGLIALNGSVFLECSNFENNTVAIRPKHNSYISINENHHAGGNTFINSATNVILGSNPFMLDLTNGNSSFTSNSNRLFDGTLTNGSFLETLGVNPTLEITSSSNYYDVFPPTNYALDYYLLNPSGGASYAPVSI